MTAGNFTVNMKEGSIGKDITEANDVPKRLTNKKWILALVGVLSFILVIAAITMVAVYFGTTFHNEESFKKFTKERYTPEEEEYTEEFEVSSDELIVSYSVGTAVFDSKRGLLIFKPIDGPQKCYIAPYNITDLPDTSALVQLLDEPDEEEKESDHLIDYTIHPTGVSLAYKETISSAANKVCEGADSEWAYLSKETVSGLRRHKRRPAPEVDIKITEKGCTVKCSFEVKGVKVKIQADIPWSVLKGKN